ncbi:hypothetical protein Tdes44962_MAKER03046 [Teratosphaeria destructans]|uniref:Uncharacterized protein n=1 Tax=Teratosphaeria destructans TaxID=418781 RepID=A0A9W7SRK3_9PEZI|nr:hypothetical protein Tdes44962_MAKER03046 [Teratosphaeria destructans]
MDLSDYLCQGEIRQLNEAFDISLKHDSTLVFWTGIPSKLARDWAYKNGLKTLTMAMGPLYATNKRARPQSRKSDKLWSRYMKGASWIFAQQACQSRHAVVLTSAPPNVYSLREHSSYRDIEEPILKGSRHSAHTIQIDYVHPTVPGAMRFRYQVWPEDRISEWIDFLECVAIKGVVKKIVQRTILRELERSRILENAKLLCLEEVSSRSSYTLSGCRLQEPAVVQKAAKQAKVEEEQRAAQARRAIKQARVEKEQQAAQAKRAVKQASVQEQQRVAQAKRAIKQARVEKEQQAAQAKRAVKQARVQEQQRVAQAKRAVKQAKVKKAQQTAQAKRAVKQARVQEQQRVAQAKRAAKQARVQEQQRVAQAKRAVKQAKVKKAQQTAQAKRAVKQARVQEQQRLAQAKRAAKQARVQEQQRLAQAKRAVKQARVKEEQRAAQSVIE